jgi:glucans biosynthesis protein C
VRLGLPVAAYVLLVHPLTNTVSDLPFADAHGFGYYVRILDFGVMWFVVALLVFSLVYAGLREVRPAGPARNPVRLGVLLVVAGAGIAVASYAVWQVWPWNSDALFGSRLGEWPQGAVLFALGVHAGENGWLDDVPRSVSSRLALVAALGTFLAFGLFGLLVALGGAEEVVDHAAGIGTGLFALLDGVVAISLSLWFVLWIRRRWPTHGLLLGKAARGSYATYLLHPLVLTTIMVTLAPLPLPPELKFVLVSLLGVTACFTVGYALTRVPGVSRIL